MKHFWNTTFALLLSFVYLTDCRPAVMSANDPRRWDYHPAKVTDVPTIDSNVMLLAVKPYRVKPWIIFYTDLSLREVTIQIAATYNKHYVKFIKPIDTAEIGALGGGHTGTDGTLTELLHYLSYNPIDLHARLDTIIVRRTAE